MAEQEDRWTRWLNWEHWSYKRDMEHMKGEAKPFGGMTSFDRFYRNLDQWEDMANWIQVQCQAGEYCNAFGGVKSFMSQVHQTMGILMYAIYDTRRGLEGVSMSKEEIFDLWLERASEPM